MTIWLLINSVAILGIAGIQFLVIRQVGAMLFRLGPIGARSSDSEGPRDGEYLSHQLSPIRTQLKTSDKDVLYLFVSRSCSVCKEIKACAEKLAPRWKNDVQIVLLYDEQARSGEPELPNTDGLYRFNEGRSLRESLRINSVPYGIRVDDSDRMIGKGLVNGISHVESLLELESPKTTGSGSATEQRRAFS